MLHDRKADCDCQLYEDVEMLAIGCAERLHTDTISQRRLSVSV